MKTTTTTTTLPEEILDSDSIADEIKNEISVNVLLEKVEDTDTSDDPEDHQGPQYELNWGFIDKETIRVTFDLFSVPRSLIENNRNSVVNKRKLNLLATMTTMPSRSVKSITVLQYFHYIVRPYKINREIILKLEKLHMKNSTSRRYGHFSNTLVLTALNHHEKYSVCICYYQTNSSTNVPDLLLCQDIVNDYSKFSELRADAKHGLVFITTQYSIIIALLVVLQSVFTMRKRRVTHLLSQLVTTKAHSFRTTLSAVSLARHSFSSLDAAAEHQHHQHATNGHAVRHEPTVEEEKGIKKRILSSPAIVISDGFTSINPDVGALDETEPFLPRIPSKNHVHFLLGQGEGSDDEDDHENENTDVNTHMTVPTQRGPYDDQGDALLSMAHILDTNKPWSRHSDQTSPV